MKLVRAEDDFAKATKAPGSMKASFLKVLDSAALAISSGHASPAVATYSALPDSSGVILHWWWHTAAVSADGQIGYTSGPYYLHMPGGNGKPDTDIQGYYLSVWKQDDRHQFKLMIDGGITLNVPQGTLKGWAFFLKGSRYSYEAAPDEASFDAALDAFKKQAALNAAAAYDSFLTARPQLLRNHAVPPDNRHAALQQIENSTMETTGEHRVLASSHDFGYSYGQSGKKYFIRIWIYENDHWKILAELMNA